MFDALIIAAGEGQRLRDEGINKSKPLVEIKGIPLIQRLIDNIVKLALQFNVPIIPVTIRGSEKSLRKGQKFPRPAKVEIIYGEPLKLDDGKGRLTKDEIQQAVEKIRKEIQII